LKEKEIIQYCKQGDQRGFKALVEQYAPKLMGICIRYLQNEFEAKDAVQETFIKVFQNIENYKTTGNFSGWLRKIAINTSLVALRKKRNGFAFLENTGLDEEWKYEAEIEIELNEQDILNMIQSLPEHYRIIFNLALIEGYSHVEIAKLLGIQESTSRSKLTRARKKLQIIYLNRMRETENIKYKIR